MKNKVKNYRKEKNITQEQLARIIDITLKQVQNIENDRSIPRVDIAIKIKRALEVEKIEELFDIDSE
jgi:DNA-binding XRE family transcriptional regulator